ncbi:PH domain-containing protein [Vagococcus zengguangii]|uniref:YdbS-like PH domain-containing protein n=1 Tax=Vagococcus zengguangii TaxID=2571750 RepID=A0A4D7CZF5_9ENTE|nr:PH domain-containing protein [Vagococcus zengguangii]QCI86956.1 hypothetical protein FA707_08245 [Vagococcus zengguangii]TLG81001.1 hypothetical protein FE258_03715 [Vagococcus zengguangii]
MSNKAHFHPFSVLVEFIRHLKSWFFVFVLGYINLKSSAYFWLGAGSVVFLILMITVIGYWSSYYQITNEHIVIYKGLVNKRETIIPYNRIQTLKQRQWFFLKPFHLVQLLIETAGGDNDEPEASLPVIKEETVQLIEHYRRSNQQINQVEKEPEVVPTSDNIDLFDLRSADTDEQTKESKTVSAQYTITNQDILMFALTDLGMMTAMFTLFFFLQEYLPKKWFDKISKESLELLQAGWLLTISICLIVVVIMAAFSVMKSLMKYYQFKVEREERTLTIESGLFERKTQKIPLTKIQGIKIKQPLMRKLFGIVSVELSLAGGQSADDMDTSDQTLYLLPIVREYQVFTTLNQLLPEWQFEQPDLKFTSRDSLWYFLRWKLLAAVIVTAVVSYFSFRMASLVGIGIVLLSLLSAWLQSHFQGYAIQSTSRLCLQSFKFGTKTMTFVEKEKVQAFAEKTGKWLYQKQLGHVSLWVKASLADEEVCLRYLNFGDIRKLKQFYREVE